MQLMMSVRICVGTNWNWLPLNQQKHIIAVDILAYPDDQHHSSLHPATDRQTATILVTDENREPLNKGTPKLKTGHGRQDRRF